MPISDQTRSPTPTDARALRASLAALVHDGHGDDLLHLQADGSFSTTPTRGLRRLKSAFRSLRDVFRRSTPVAPSPQSARFSTLHVLYDMARGRHGADVANRAFVPKPLAQRVVAVGDPRNVSVARAVQLLDDADRKADETRAANHARIDALLQPPRTALHAALARAGWASNSDNGPLDPASERFAEEYVRRLASEHPEFQRRALDDEELAACCADVANLMAELGKATGPQLPAMLDAVLKDAVACASSQGMAGAVRSKVIEAAFDRMVSVDGDESVLWNAVLEESAKLWQREDPVEVGDTHMLKMIGKEISNEMKADFAHRAHRLVEHLGLPPETPVDRVLEHCQGRLVDNIQTAVREHFQALEMIAKDEALNPEQRQILASLGRARRLDPVQVEQLKWFSNSLGKAIQAMGGHARLGRPEPMFERLKIANDAFAEVCQEMGRHAETMWVARAFDDATARDDLFGLAIQLATAGRYSTPDDARLAFEALTGAEEDEGAGDAEGETPGGPSSSTGISPLDAVQQVMQACDQAGSTQIGDMKARYAAIVIELARRSGVRLDEVVETKTVRVRKAAGIVEEPVDVTLEEQLMDRIVGKPLPLSALPLGVLSQTLLDVPRGDDAGIRTNGALAGGRAAELVAPDFDATQAFLNAAPTHATTTLVETEHGPLASDFVAAIDQLDIRINDVPLSGTPAERVASFFEMTSGCGDEETDRRVALEISRRMNPVAMRRWMTDLQDAAMAGRGESDTATSPLHSTIELNSDKQGSWSLAATLMATPALGATAEPTPEDGGVILSRIRSVIPVPSIVEGQPAASPRDALVTFAF